MNSFKHIIGIDEAGRGPLAGPVSVGVVCIPKDFAWEALPGVTDSKKLSPLKREQIFKQAQKLHKERVLTYAVVMVSARTIDTIGIVSSIQKAMDQALSKIQIAHQADDLYKKSLVKLDGGLKAPKEFLHQETIIKGDQKEKVIGLASIMAKVTRDRYMVRVAQQKQYAHYHFDIHKGYGTKAHRQAIQQYGVSPLHRKSFCKNCLK